MTLEEMVVSLPIAKRLKELGVKQDSLHWWDEDDEQVYRSAADVGCIAAFNTAELGVMLPPWCSSSRDHDGTWSATPALTYHDVPSVFAETTEANARGRLLIELVERDPQYFAERGFLDRRIAEVPDATT